MAAGPPLRRARGRDRQARQPLRRGGGVDDITSAYSRRQRLRPGVAPSAASSPPTARCPRRWPRRWRRCSPRWSWRRRSTTTRWPLLTAKKNLRVLAAPAAARGRARPAEHRRRAAGAGGRSRRPRPHVRGGSSRRSQPDDEQWSDLEFAWQVCAAVSSQRDRARSRIVRRSASAPVSRTGSTRPASPAAKAAGRAAGGSLRQRRLLPVPRRARRRRGGRDRGRDPAGRQRARRRGDRGRRRARHRHGLHRRAPLPTLSLSPSSLASVGSLAARQSVKPCPVRRPADAPGRAPTGR